MICLFWPCYILLVGALVWKRDQVPVRLPSGPRLPNVRLVFDRTRGLDAL